MVLKTVKGFRYLGDRLVASGGSEAAVTARTRIELVNLENAVKGVMINFSHCD